MFLERHNYARNTDSSFRSISTIELRDNHARKTSSNFSNPISYTNEAFVVDYDRARQFGYDSTEHLYLEIGEFTAERTGKKFNQKIESRSIRIKPDLPGKKIKPIYIEHVICIVYIFKINSVICNFIYIYFYFYSFRSEKYSRDNVS